MTRRFTAFALTLLVGCALATQAWGAPRPPKHDCAATASVEAGPPPVLSILELDYGAFRYPRTLPLKAAATDTDLLQMRCEACDGSEGHVLLDDDVHPGEHGRSGFRWKRTSGPGSVDAPFDPRAHEAALGVRDRAKTTLERKQAALRDLEKVAKEAQAAVSALEAALAPAPIRLHLSINWVRN